MCDGSALHTWSHHKTHINSVKARVSAQLKYARSLANLIVVSVALSRACSQAGGQAHRGHERGLGGRVELRCGRRWRHRIAVQKGGRRRWRRPLCPVVGRMAAQSRERRWVRRSGRVANIFFAPSRPPWLAKVATETLVLLLRLRAVLHQCVPHQKRKVVRPARNLPAAAPPARLM
jgi:hypothetical protein